MFNIYYYGLRNAFTMCIHLKYVWHPVFSHGFMTPYITCNTILTAHVKHAPFVEHKYTTNLVLVERCFDGSVQDYSISIVNAMVMWVFRNDLILVTLAKFWPSGFWNEVAIDDP